MSIQKREEIQDLPCRLRGYMTLMIPGERHIGRSLGKYGWFISFFLTFSKKCAKLGVTKRLWGRHAVRVRFSEREPFCCKASVPLPGWIPLRSRGSEMARRVRPLKRQWVTAKAVTRVEPWNTSVSHPWFSGGGYFLYLPRKEILDIRYKIWDILKCLLDLVSLMVIYPIQPS